MINFKELNLKMPFRYIFQEVFRDGFNNVIEQLNPQTAAGGSHQHSKMTINNRISYWSVRHQFYINYTLKQLSRCIFFFSGFKIILQKLLRIDRSFGIEPSNDGMWLACVGVWGWFGQRWRWCVCSMRCHCTCIRGTDVLLWRLNVSIGGGLEFSIWFLVEKGKIRWSWSFHVCWD